MSIHTPSYRYFPSYRDSQCHSAIGGQAATVVTSIGGEAITLAGSAGGHVTSFAGSEYTVATAAVASVVSSVTGSRNAAAGAHSLGFTPSVIMGLTTVVVGALVGAAITL